jgi:hypothetical protein
MQFADKHHSAGSKPALFDPERWAIIIESLADQTNR